MTKVPLTSESFDTNSNFDNATNYNYTAPVTGFYWFYGIVYFFVQNTVVVQGFLYKNGSILKLGDFKQNLSGGNNYLMATVGGLISLTAGDTVDFRAAQNAGTTQTMVSGASSTYFEGFLVSRT